jgi:hypothetical protein
MKPYTRVIVPAMAFFLLRSRDQGLLGKCGRAERGLQAYARQFNVMAATRLWPDRDNYRHALHESAAQD